MKGEGKGSLDLRAGVVLVAGYAVQLVGVAGHGAAGHGHARVLVRVDRLAEVDGVLELLQEHGLAGVSGHLEQEEARVALG